MHSHSQKALKDCIDTSKPGKNELSFWWLGQHGFVIKTDGTVIYFDPFLSDHPGRLLPPPLAPLDLDNADLILGSHDHVDHIDRKAWSEIKENKNKAIFIVPEAVRENLIDELKLEKKDIIGLNDSQCIEVGKIKVFAIAAAHEFLDCDPKTGHFPYLGYIIKINDFTIYHSGDTCIYEGMSTKLRNWKIDVAFLPVNGRDAERLSCGCIGNMTYQEAADLAGVLKPGLTVPGHYGMFKKNTINPDLFKDYMAVKYPQLKTCLCEPGKESHYPVKNF